MSEAYVWEGVEWPLCVALGSRGVTLEGTGLPAAQGLLEPSFSPRIIPSCWRAGHELPGDQEQSPSFHGPHDLMCKVALRVPLPSPSAVSGAGF